MYQILQEGEGMPKLHWFGSEADCNVMVVDLLGKSLEDLLERQGRRMSEKTVAMLGKQMVDRVEWLRSQSIIHRDIKPDNFLMGLGANAHKLKFIHLSKKAFRTSNLSFESHYFRLNRLHLIDFGLSKRYRNKGEHIPYVDEKKLTGTARLKN